MQRNAASAAPPGKIASTKRPRLRFKHQNPEFHVGTILKWGFIRPIPVVPHKAVAEVSKIGNL